MSIASHPQLPSLTNLPALDPPPPPPPPPPSIPPPPPPGYARSGSTDMSAGSSSVWKTLLVPPLLALIIYLSAIYIIFPLYRHFSSSRNSSASTLSSILPASLRSRLSNVQIRDLVRFSRRRSLSGEESLLGDEELEEGLLDSTDERGGRRGRGGAGGGGRGGREVGGEEYERRLSRELEVGFRDESDEEEDEEDRRGRR